MNVRYILLFILAVLLLVDWQQTLRIARNPDRWFERNPVLGKHPSVARVHTWFAVCAVAAGALLLLPATPAIALSVVWIAAEAWCVTNNHAEGLDD